MDFEEKGFLLIAETIISTQTAVETPPDPISGWNYADHRGKYFWDDHWRSCGALKNA